jgi:hypothetical protein
VLPIIKKVKKKKTQAARERHQPVTSNNPILETNNHEGISKIQCSAFASTDGALIQLAARDDDYLSWFFADCSGYRNGETIHAGLSIGAF